MKKYLLVTLVLFMQVAVADIEIKDSNATPKQIDIRPQAGPTFEIKPSNQALTQVKPAQATTLLPPPSPPSQLSQSVITGAHAAVANATTLHAQTLPNVTTAIPAAAIVPEVADTIEIPVAGYDNAERTMAISKAFLQSITAVNASYASSPQVKALIPKADTLVQTYTYVNKPQANGQSALYLQVKFDPKSIEGLLEKIQKSQAPVPITKTAEATQAAALTTETTKKPTTLIWLSRNYITNWSILDESSNDILLPALKRSAASYNMPIILPAMDLRDQAAVKAEEVCNFDANLMRNISSRYGAENILVGCVREGQQFDTGWNSDWLLIQGDHSSRFSTAGNNVEELMDKVFQNVSGGQAKPQDAAAGGQDTNDQLVMRVTNVGSLDAYAEIIKYIRKQSPVTRVDLMNIAPAEIQIKVSVIGGKKALATALSAENKLTQNPNPQGLPPGVDLDYSWAGTK